MRVIAKSRLREFWLRHADAEQTLKAWYREASRATWRHAADIRASHGSADFVGDRVIFNFGGNKYRLIAAVDYGRHGVLIRFIGTHAEYNRVDARTV